MSGKIIYPSFDINLIKLLSTKITDNKELNLKNEVEPILDILKAVFWKILGRDTT